MSKLFTGASCLGCQCVVTDGVEVEISTWSRPINLGHAIPFGKK